MQPISTNFSLSVQNDIDPPIRRLHIVLGDQLNPEVEPVQSLDPSRDAVWMAEVSRESTKVWSHRARIVLFLSAMRHFRDDLVRQGLPVRYHALEKNSGQTTLSGLLKPDLERLSPDRVTLLQPGEWSVREEIEECFEAQGVPFEILPDPHFLCSQEEFDAYAEGRDQLVLEYFYREMRRRYDVLMDGDEPVGGAWNFDDENRESFSSGGPGSTPAPTGFPPDDVTETAIQTVRNRFPDHPGSLDRFDWPVTPAQAEEALSDFIEHRLPNFGPYQDAMWSHSPAAEHTPYLYHSRISAALNLKLLDPMEAVRRAEQALDRPDVSISSVEGFIRQILGWREFVRCIYWREMPEYKQLNALDADRELPGFFWTGETKMNCLRETIDQTLEFGYAHHIQRLMVTGLFALLFGVRPKEVHEWYLAVYVDAVEWVELPNTLGMSQYADGGILGTKPYTASGNYINRMSNYCADCPYDPGSATGEDACPFTTLYWDFLRRHEDRLEDNHRMNFQLMNLRKKSDEELRQIARRSREIQSDPDGY